MIILSINSDNLIRLDRLTNEQTGDYVNDATVTMTLRDSAGDAIAAATDLALSYVAASDGRYHGVLPDTLTLSSGTRYYLDITAISGSLQRFDRMACRAQYSSGH